MTVIAVASDSKSMLPPLYRPAGCSVYRGPMCMDVCSALGTIQVMVGLFIIGLGPGRWSLHPGDFAHLGVAYWLGGVCLAAGIMTLLFDRFRSTFLVCSTVLVNIAGCIVSGLGIMMCIRDMEDDSVARICDEFDAGNNDNCRIMAYYTHNLLTDMDITTIVCAALNLCVGISIAVLGISALVRAKDVEGCRDSETYQPVEVLKITPGV